MDEMNLNGNPTPDAVPVTDIPDSFGDAVIPDPVASPDSYGDFTIPTPEPVTESVSMDPVIPDPVASPDSYGGFGIPTPEPVTESVSVDPVIPDPVASSDSYGGFGIPTSEPAAENISADSIVSPMMEQPAPQPEIPQAAPTQEIPQDPQYSGHYSWNGNQYVENGAAPYGQQNGYAQSGSPNAGNVPNYRQPVYSQDANGQMNLDPELEGRANTLQMLGIISLILCILGGCGCGCIGTIISIVGLVKANGMSTVMHMMSEQSKSRVKLGKTLCIVGIILSIVSMLIGLVTIFFPILLGYMEAASM